MNSAGVAKCQCPAPLVPIAGACGLPSTCTPNPCTSPRATCVETPTGAQCGCAEGVAPVADGGCAAGPSWSCTTHEGDALEANDCPLQAKQLGEGALNATIFPASDEDWYRFDVAEGSFLQIIASASDDLSLTLFDDDGFSPTWAAAGSARTVWARGGGWLRVRALRNGTTLDYSLLSQVDVDDWPDGALTRTVLVPAAMSGTVFGPTDVDTIRLDVPVGRSMVVVNGLLPPDVTVTVRSSNGMTRPLRDATTNEPRVRIVVPAGLTAFLDVSAPLRRSWSVEVSDVGGDDYDDEALFAAPIPLGTTITGTYQQAGDVDVVRVSQRAGHVYLATCTNIVPCPSPWTAATDADRIVSARFYSTADWSLRIDDLGPEQTDTLLALDTTTPGRVRFDGELNTFSFDVPPGHGVALAVEPPTAVVRLDDADRTDLNHATVWSEFGERFVVTVSSPTPTDFVLALTDLGPDDFGSSPATATVLGPASPIHGIQPNGDVDLFRLSANAPNDSVVVSCALLDGGACGLQAFTPSGVGTSGRFIGLERVDQPWFVTPMLDRRTWDYVLTLTDIGPDDVPGPAAPLELDAGTPVTRNVFHGTFGWAGDVDAFTMIAPGGALALSCNCTLGALDQNQNPIFFNVLPVAAGTRVNVTLTRTTPGPYTFHYDALGPDDFDCRTSPILSGTHFTGLTELFNDVDCFSVPTTVGHIYELPTSPGSVGVTVDGQNVTPPFRATSSTAEVRVYSVPVSAQWVVDVNDLGLDDFPELPTAPGVINLLDAGVVAGRFDFTSDSDAFLLEGPARGDPITLTVTSTFPPGIFFNGLTSASTSPTAVIGASPGLWVSLYGSVGPYSVSATAGVDDFSGVVPTFLDGGVVDAAVHANDLDLFAVATLPGDQVEVTLTWVSAPCGSFVLKDPSSVVTGSPAVSDGGVWTIEVTGEPWCSIAGYHLTVGVGP